MVNILMEAGDSYHFKWNCRFFVDFQAATQLLIMTHNFLQLAISQFMKLRKKVVIVIRKVSMKHPCRRCLAQDQIPVCFVIVGRDTTDRSWILEFGHEFVLAIGVLSPRPFLLMVVRRRLIVVIAGRDCPESPAHGYTLKVEPKQDHRFMPGARFRNAASPHMIFFLSQTNKLSAKRGFPVWITVQKDRYKNTMARQAYDCYNRLPRYELYNLEKDPHELQNLAENLEYIKIKNELMQQLNKWRIQTKDPLSDSRVLKEYTKRHDEAALLNTRSLPEGYLDGLPGL